MSVLQIARWDEFVSVARKRLPEEAVLHSISVARLLVRLAETLALDRQKAITAGLLHDLHKTTPPNEQLRLAKHYGLAITPVQLAQPKLLHGFLAAEECRRDLGVEDSEILEAIAWHTTGRPGLGPVGIALFFADFAEPSREHPEAEQARALLRKEGFPAAVRFVAGAKCQYVRTQRITAPNTEAFYHWLCATPSLRAREGG